jgi:transcriptional regulator with XRE-family HTH domain
MNMTIGARIKGWRESKGWTQQELAEVVGVTHAAVYQWELSDERHTTPSLLKLEKVVEVLGLTMREFYGPIPKAKRSA